MKMPNDVTVPEEKRRCAYVFTVQDGSMVGRVCDLPLDRPIHRKWDGDSREGAIDISHAFLPPKDYGIAFTEDDEQTEKAVAEAVNKFRERQQNWMEKYIGDTVVCEYCDVVMICGEDGYANWSADEEGNDTFEVCEDCANERGKNG